MKFLVYVFIVFLLILTEYGYSQNHKIEWISNDITNYTSNLWLTNNDSLAITSVAFLDSLMKIQNFELEYWDLTKKELIKTVNLNRTIVNADMQINLINSEFYYLFNDTIVFHNLNDFNQVTKIKSQIRYDRMWFDYSVKNYCLLYTNKNTIIFAKMDPDSKQITKQDTIVIPNFKQIRFNKSENGSFFVVNNGNYQLLVYDSKDCKLLYSRTMELPINSYAISNTGKYLVAMTNPEDEFPFRIYNIADDSKNFFIPNKVNDLATIKFSKDDSKLIIASNYSGQFVYTINDDKPLLTLNGTNKVSFCLSDKSIIDIGKRNILTLYDIDSKSFVELTRFDKTGKNRQLISVRFNENNNSFYTTGNEGIISERLNSDCKIVQEYKLKQNSTQILNSIHQKIKDSLIIYNTTNLYYLNALDYEMINNFSFEGFSFTPIEISNDNKWLVGSTLYKGTFLYNLTNDPGKKKVFYLDSGRNYSYGAAFSSNSRYLATGGTDNIIKVYDLSNIYDNAEPIAIASYPRKISSSGQIVPYTGNGIKYISFIDNDSKIVSSSSDFYNFKVWSAITGDSLYSPTSPTQYWKNGNFPGISNIIQRNKFNDYVTVDIWGHIFIWDNKFNFKSYYSINLNLDPAISFDYNPTSNNLLIGCQNTTIAMVKLDDETDVVDTKSIERINLTPNPASDFIYLQDLGQNTESSIQIFDIMGLEVGKSSFMRNLNQTTGQSKIDISYLAPGVYLIKIGNTMSRFVKL